MTLQARNIMLSVGQKVLLNDVNFTVKKGKVVGLMGPNGAGKSSLLKVLTGITRAQQGEVFLGDNVLAAKESAKSIAYLPDSPPCSWSLSVELVISLGRFPHQGPLSRLSENDAKAVRDALSETALLRMRGRTLNTLSHGERMRAMLARCFATGATYFILDEPLGGLDAKHQLALMQILKSKAASGCGVLLVLHDFSIAQRFCDEIAFMHKSKIVAHDIPDKVITHSRLKQVFDIEAAIGSMHGVPFIIPV
jgi:iron complex transport system ATP-binding protein